MRVTLPSKLTGWVDDELVFEYRSPTLSLEPSGNNACGFWCKLPLQLTLQSSSMCSNTRRHDSAVCFLVWRFRHFNESPVQKPTNTTGKEFSLISIEKEKKTLSPPEQHLTFFYQHVNNSLRAELIFFFPLSEDFPQASIYRAGWWEVWINPFSSG